MVLLSHIPARRQTEAGHEASRAHNASRRRCDQPVVCRSRAAEGDAGDRFLSGASPGAFAPFVTAFHRGLSETDNKVIE
jgi:hypothetical protein